MEQAYGTTKRFSEARLAALRAAAGPLLPDGATVAVFGSHARREASALSDIDYVVIADVERADVEIAGGRPADIGAIDAAIRAVVPLPPAADGAFAARVGRAEMLSNLGGEHDTNRSLTRRLLLLLEGDFLAGEAAFMSLRRELIARYVAATPRDHQLALFLLNDIIRYWRTMTVDFTWKTREAGKPWAIRNLKLVFSRKLMYAAGLFSVAMTVDRSEAAKVDMLESLLSLPVIERMQAICGTDRFAGALAHYDRFLAVMGDPAERSRLTALPRGAGDDEGFRALKNEGHAFTRALLALLEQTFHTTHPIHRAIVF